MPVDMQSDRFDDAELLRKDMMTRKSGGVNSHSWPDNLGILSPMNELATQNQRAG